VSGEKDLFVLKRGYVRDDSMMRKGEEVGVRGKDETTRKAYVATGAARAARAARAFVAGAFTHLAEVLRM
jgi:hypothetical protein